MKVISTYICTNLDAGPKAKLDVEKILEKDFNCRINTLKNDNNNSFINKKIKKIKKAIFINKNFIGDELTVVQAPFSTQVKLMNKAINKIAFIHDIEGLRKNKESLLEIELNFLSTCKYIVCHNNNMKEFLINNGIDKEKIYILELFDYLCNKNEEILNITRSVDSKKPKIVFAGNLSKSKFLNQLDERKMEFVLNLYGKGIVHNINNKEIYKGTLTPDEMPYKLEGDLGLVWDGELDESDENFGVKNYMKYNNPHKLSCYIAAELPVIVWRKAAVAELVKKYNIGYLIDNIYDINNLEINDYNEKLENVKKIGNKVRNGEFTKKIINEILKQQNSVKE